MLICVLGLGPLHHHGTHVTSVGKSPLKLFKSHCIVSYYWKETSQMVTEDGMAAIGYKNPCV